MSKLKTVLTFCLFLFETTLLAQKIFYGTIHDIQTGEPLAMTNIWVEGTYRGTISNEQGEYRLTLTNLPAVLVIRYIGYETKRVSISSETPSQLDVRLMPVAIPMKTVVFSGEDPAIAIMREVIQKKEVWISSLQTFQVDAYTRVVIENDSGIVTIAESTSDVYWHEEKGWREMIRWRRETANIKPEQNFAFSSDPINFYHDDIEFFGFKMPGPTNPNIFSFYNFKLIGERLLDEKKVYDISIEPKNKLIPGFIGRISILDQDYALLDLDLKPSDTMIFPVPFKDVAVQFKQQFSNFGKDYWIPVDNRMIGSIKVGIPGLEIPRILFKVISRYSDYQVNVSLPDSLYQEDEVFHVDSAAVAGKQVDSKDPVVPLNAEEDEAYTQLDSTMTIEKAFKPTGFLAKMAKIKVGTGEDESQDGEGTAKLYDWKPKIRYNRVEGFHAGLGLDVKLGKRLAMGGMSAYNTGLKSGSNGAFFRFYWDSKQNGFIEFNYEKDTKRRTESRNYTNIINSIQTLFTGDAYFDYYESKGWCVTASQKLTKLPLGFQLTWNDKTHTSLNKTTDYHFFNRDEKPRINSQVNEGKLQSIEFRLTAGPEFIPWGPISQHRFEFRMESSPEFFNSDFRFTSYDILWDGYINTFFRRRFLPNRLDFRIAAGTSTGTLPLQRMGSLDVRFGAFTPFGTFHTLKSLPIEGEKYAAIFWEHHFRTVPFEIVGLRSLAKRGWGFILHGASGRTWISEDRLATLTHSFQYLDEIHHEIGLSLNGILGFFRLDVTKAIGKRGLYAGISVARLF